MRLWNTEEIANFLGKSPQWVRENHKSLGIPAFKLGQHWRFNPEEVQMWIKNNHRFNSF
jgi:excisionase family DNA binding protein